jgi:hypothetical protein
MESPGQSAIGTWRWALFSSKSGTYEANGCSILLHYHKIIKRTV